ncbi:hypothetical protein M8C21_023653, partial [Ambrosia artemisiifolia]
MCDVQEMFRNIRLQLEYDIHDPKGHHSTILPSLEKWSKIVEIGAAHDTVFALAQPGVCAAFSQGIIRGQPEAGLDLFESECLKLPGYVEFDDVNRKVLTFSAQDIIYKVFELKNYKMLYSIT